MKTIRAYQDQSEQVKSWMTSNPEDFKLHEFGGTELVCRYKDGIPKIAISDEMLPKLVKWYHLHTAHAEGMDRLEASIQ